MAVRTLPTRRAGGEYQSGALSPGNIEDRPPAQLARAANLGSQVDTSGRREAANSYADLDSPAPPAGPTFLVAASCRNSATMFRRGRMKNLLLPVSVGAVVVGLTFASSLSKSANAQQPMAVAPRIDVAELGFVQPVSLPKDGTCSGLVAGKRGDGQINQLQLAGSEFIYTSPEAGVIHVPMSAVAYYRLAAEK